MTDETQSDEIKKMTEELRQIKGILVEIKDALVSPLPMDPSYVPVQAPAYAQPISRELMQEAQPVLIEADVSTGGMDQGEFDTALKYYPDSPVTRNDIIDGLKFNFRSLIQISQSRPFTLTALQLFILSGLLNAITIGINLYIFGNVSTLYDVIAQGTVIFYSYLSMILLLAFFLEFTMKNMAIEGVSFTSSMRITGFLSIIVIIRSLLSVIYNFYIDLVGGSGGISYFITFELISWMITILLLLIYLTIYIKNRAGLTQGFTVTLIVATSIFTGSLYAIYFFNIFFILSQIPIVAIALLGLGVLSLIGLQLAKSRS